MGWRCWTVFWSILESPRTLSFRTASGRLRLITLVHDARTPTARRGDGRPERRVFWIITSSEFNGLLQEVRRVIGALLGRTHSTVQPRRPKTHESLRAATAVSVGCISRENVGCARPSLPRGSSRSSPLNLIDASPGAEIRVLAVCLAPRAHRARINSRLHATQKHGK